MKFYLISSTREQFWLNTLAGVAGAIVSYGFGEISGLLGFFLTVIAVDYLSGVAASWVDGTGLSSKIGYIGLLRKGLMVLVVGLAHRLDLLLSMDIIMTGTVYFYLANELVSLTENYGRMGLPLPDVIKQAIKVLKAKGDKQNDTNV